MLNIFAIFSLLLAPIDGVIPLLFQSVHIFFLCVYIYLQSVHVQLTSHRFEWFEGCFVYLESLMKTCSDPPILAGLVCPSCVHLDLSASLVWGFWVFFFCFMPATHFSAIPPLQDSHSVGVCIDLASVWWTLNFSVCGPPPPHFLIFFLF